MDIDRKSGKASRWRDWYEQAKRDRGRAELDLRYEYYEWACFTAQQAAEKALKALGLFLGLNLWGHSLSELVRAISERVEVDEGVFESARRLDFYYIPPRYPNGFPSGKPADFFGKGEASEALNAADQILRFCDSHLAGSR